MAPGQDAGPLSADWGLVMVLVAVSYCEPKLWVSEFRVGLPYMQLAYLAGSRGHVTKTRVRSGLINIHKFNKFTLI